MPLAKAVIAVTTSTRAVPPSAMTIPSMVNGIVVAAG
jgi:hypothetical protein